MVLYLSLAETERSDGSPLEPDDCDQVRAADVVGGRQPPPRGVAVAQPGTDLLLPLPVPAVLGTHVSILEHEPIFWVLHVYMYLLKYNALCIYY